jgi:DNA-binding transcriptional LysR family regulator
MHRAMLESVIAAEGSLRQAARALRVPRATLSRWLGRLDG